MGSDEIHFNVSVGSDEQSHRTVSTNHNLFEEKGEPKRYRTEVLPLTSLKPVLNWANVCSPNILRTVRRTMIRFLTELLVRRTWFGQFDELYFCLLYTSDAADELLRVCSKFGQKLASHYKPAENK